MLYLFAFFMLLLCVFLGYFCYQLKWLQNYLQKSKCQERNDKPIQIELVKKTKPHVYDPSLSQAAFDASYPDAAEAERQEKLNALRSGKLVPRAERILLFIRNIQDTDGKSLWETKFFTHENRMKHYLKERLGEQSYTDMMNDPIGYSFSDIYGGCGAAKHQGEKELYYFDVVPDDVDLKQRPYAYLVRMNPCLPNNHKNVLYYGESEADALHFGEEYYTSWNKSVEEGEKAGKDFGTIFFLPDVVKVKMDAM